MEHVREAPPINPLYTLPSILQRIDLATLFPARQPLEIELGSGDGSFLATYAALCSGRNFIGVERLLGRIRKLGRKAARAGLANVRAVRIESSYFLEHLLPRHAAAAIHIYFPDPWPKRRHERHRLVKQGFPALAQRALQPGGVVYLRTDDEPYFQEMKQVFAQADAFHPMETPEALQRLLTDFEREFHAQGKQTLRAAYQFEA